MIFIFGQSQKGLFCRPTLCKEVIELFYQFGHQAEQSQGIFFATQALLLEKPCVFFRIEEEGFNKEDYLKGLDILKNSWSHVNIQAIGLPGVGDHDLIERTERLFFKRRSILLFGEEDLFDYLTQN